MTALLSPLYGMSSGLGSVVPGREEGEGIALPGEVVDDLAAGYPMP